MLTHLGIIADGNRRWAREKNLPTIEGHKKGLEVIEQIIMACAAQKIPYLTLYVFSNENWSRSDEEVSYIMSLALNRISKYAEKMAKNNIKMLILGAKDRVDPKLLKKIEEAEALTKDCSGLTVGFCFNYGGEREIADAATAAQVEEGIITPETITKHLYHPEIPACDMIVRTSGEQRISGFMLWRAAYAEFFFLDKYFPDMDADDIKNIINEYESRNRRFGK